MTPKRKPRMIDEPSAANASKSPTSSTKDGCGSGHWHTYPPPSDDSHRYRHNHHHPEYPRGGGDGDVLSPSYGMQVRTRYLQIKIILDHHLRGMLEAVLNGYLWVLVAVCSRA